MSKFLAFYKNGVYKFCIKTDDSKSLGLQRNLIYRDEGIRVTDEIEGVGTWTRLIGFVEIGV